VTPSRLRWLLGLSVLVAAAAVAWLLAAYVHAPWLASCVLVAAIGWVLYRLAHVSRVGIVLWCLAAVVGAACCCLVLSTTEITIPFAPLLYGAVWAVFSFASSIAFLVAALRTRTRRGRNCACCMLLLVTLIACNFTCGKIANHRCQQHAVQHTNETFIKLNALATEIESIRATLKRLPDDEKELVKLRGKPMPTFYRHYQIRYERLEKDHYYLTCSLSDFWGHAWDFWPWIVQYNDPASPRRIHAILF
jgi:hypothetical protein